MAPGNGRGAGGCAQRPGRPDRAARLSPQPARREDAQRLREQLRSLDRDAPAPSSSGAPGTAQAGGPPGASTATSTAAATADRSGASGYRIAGILFLTLSGASALTTISLFASTPSDPKAADGYDAPKFAFGITTAVTALTGFLLLGHSRSVQVTPTVTPKAVGLAISGRL